MMRIYRIASNIVKRKSTCVAAGAFLAPQTVEMLNLWNDFRKVVEFIDTNRSWLDLSLKN